MSRPPPDIEDLQRRVEAAERRAQEAEEEKRRAEEEKRRAEEEKERAEEEKERAEERAFRAENERKKAEEERDHTNTTFQEYLDLCHIHFFKNLTVQLDKTRSTKGGVTSVTGKCHPEKICPWEGFLQGQRHRFNLVYSFFHSESASSKLFDDSRTLERDHRKLCKKLLASEDDLR